MNPTLTAFLFGITLAISVGPIALLIINRSITCGFRTGALTGIAAATADLTYSLLSFAAGSVIYALLVQHEDWLQTGASMILIFFGVWMFYNTLKYRNQPVPASGAACDHAFVSTYALTMA